MTDGFAMRWGLLSVRIGILVVSIITTMLLLLAVVPLAVGGLDIKFPQDQTTGWTYNNSTNVVSFETPVQIYNGGFFDIQEFSVGIKLTDPNGTLISESSSTPTDILAGRSNLLNVRMALDLDQIEPSVMRELAFNHTTLNMSLTLSSYYMERLVNLHIGSNQTMDWTPLIDNLQFDLQALQMMKNGTSYNIQVPYGFDAGDLIVGKQVNVRTTLRDETGVLGSGSDNVSITKHYTGAMKMAISQAAAQRLVVSPANLTIDVVIDFQGAEFTQTYTRQWEPMITDLKVGTPTFSTGPQTAVNVPFGFNASSAVIGKQVQVECSISNATATISQGSSSLMVQQQTHGQVYMTFSPAESSWFLSHSQDWTITLKATLMGISITQTRFYHWNAPVVGP
jgi:hypothetical protein